MEDEEEEGGEGGRQRGGAGALGSKSEGAGAREVRLGLRASERLRSCWVAQRVMRSAMDSLNTDVKAFAVALYALALELPLQAR